VLRYALLGYAPTVTTTTAGAAVTLGEGIASKPVEMTAGFSEATSVRWQTRLGSAGRWSDVPGATTTSLTWPATRDDNGRQFRALSTGTYGTVSAGTASLSVDSFPLVAAQPSDVAVDPGQDALLQTMPSGNPYPAVTWQRRVGGYWQDIAADDDNFVADSGYLTVRNANLEQDGSLFRARLRNSVGTTWTRAVELSVAAPSTDPRPVTSGTVTWGVKASFRTYVEGSIAHGTITVSDGAVRNADGTFSFPVTGGTSSPSGTTVKLGGSVRFVGHDGPPTCATEYSPCLDLTVAKPRLVVTGSTAVLRADLTSKNETSHQVERFTDVELATVSVDGLSTSGGALSGSALGATLTAAGAKAFAGFYAEGTALDPLSLSATLGAPVAPAAPSASVALSSARSTYGAPVTATVSTGATLTVDGHPVAVSGGTATLPRDLGVGTHTLVASYAGATDSATLTVTKAETAVRWSVTNKKKATKGKRARLLVSAHLVGAPDLVVSGQVQVLRGDELVATGRLRADGTVVVRLPRLARGKHLLAVRLAGDATREALTTDYVRLRVRR
jgi:hypothetical protein